MANYRWRKIDLDTKVFRNLDEDALHRASVALENAFINEAGGHTRFPGYTEFADLGQGKVYLSKWRGDLFAVTTGGKMARLDQSANVSNIAGPVPTGSGRVVFTRTENEIVMAAGGALIRYAGGKSEKLSDDAPLSTHAAYLSGFLLAIEKDSHRFYHSEAGQYGVWNPIDVFSAEYSPDKLTALVVNDFGEALLAGPESVEQFEPYGIGDRPFVRRWAVGQGILAPYTLVAADNAAWMLNEQREFVRVSGQSERQSSDDIALVLHEAALGTIDDAWASHLSLFGQKFILLSLPSATNSYGTTGITLLLDVRQRRWSWLYAWDAALSLPAAFPAISYQSLWGRHFLGGADGKIYELKRDAYDLAGAPQRMVWRTSHMDQWGYSRVNGLRMRIKRGTGTYDQPGYMKLRVRKDAGTAWSTPQVKSLGVAGGAYPYVEFGPQGVAHTWQFEYEIESAVPIEVAGFDARVEQMG